jgi:uncharacterized membrane protein required for colicin V production
MALRLLIAFLVFAAIMALSLLLPRSLPGEIAARSFTPHAQTPCAKCPPTEQLTGAGMLAGDNAWFVNARFAAPPLNAHITLAFDGVPGTVELQHAGREWRSAGERTDTIPALTSVGERGNLVVFGLPATLRATGIAVATGTGDRIPASGFAVPVYPSTVHFNGTDIVLLLVLLATAVYGFKRGALAEVADLMAIIVSFAIAAAAFRPVASVIAAATGYAQGAAAIASGVLVIVCATAGFLLFPRLLPRIAPATSGLNPAADGALGSVVACIRQLPMLAMALTIGIDVAALHWATPSITSSMLGSALLSASKTLFSGT